MIQNEQICGVINLLSEEITPKELNGVLTNFYIHIINLTSDFNRVERRVCEASRR